MTVLYNHARMVEIVQMKWMISAVIVSLGTQAKTVQLVRKITQIFNYIQFLQLVDVFIDFSFLFILWWFLQLLQNLSSLVVLFSCLNDFVFLLFF